MNKHSWRLDNFSNSEAQAKISDLIVFLKQVRSIFFIGSPPAELVLSLIKEVIHFGISYFGSEFQDIQVRNPELKFINPKEKFLTMDGYKEIDTGMTRSVSFSKEKPRIFIDNEALQEFLTNFLQDLIDVEDIFLKEKSVLDFEDLNEILKSRRRMSSKRRPGSSRDLLLLKEVKKLRASLAYYRRAYRRVTRKSRQ
jgi:hypothetical protein